MSSLRQTLTVELENGAKWDVVADQRDYATWEMQDFYDDTRGVVRTRFVGYAASVRTGATALSWGKFSAQCVMVAAAKDPVDVDPTMPDPSGAP